LSLLLLVGHMMVTCCPVDHLACNVVKTEEKGQLNKNCCYAWAMYCILYMLADVSM